MSLAVLSTRLYDGLADHGVERAMVLVEDGRITAVDTDGNPVPEGYDVVDVGDATVLPGLIDTHAHLCLDGRPDAADVIATTSAERLVLSMRHAALRALHAGITTIRDLGDHQLLSLRLRDWFATGPETGPELVCAGTPVTITGGHGHFLGLEADGELEVRKAVRTLTKRGVDVIKVMASGGRLTPRSNTSLPQYTTAELRAAVEEAHRHGLPLTVHAYPPEAIAQAVAAGVDGIEHCFFSVPGGLAPDPAVIDAIAERGIIVGPTLGLSPGWTVPPGFRTFLDVFEPVVESMHKSGVLLVAGPDAGSLPGKPHDVLPHAVRTLAGLGLTNVEALRSATSLAARACGLEDRKGALRAGMDADLIAVRGDPVADIDALPDVCLVVRQGKVVRDDGRPGAAVQNRHAPPSGDRAGG
ncbi:amidohydrolase family protein [Plantactinospora veratri]|uniref:Amidohydrolase family protein n=1 Tax=Plantactinospora veratri TaxID=1436122 RepID=A0ABU7S8Y0_9ACTN